MTLEKWPFNAIDEFIYGSSVVNIELFYATICKTRHIQACHVVLFHSSTCPEEKHAAQLFAVHVSNYSNVQTALYFHAARGGMRITPNNLTANIVKLNAHIYTKLYFAATRVSLLALHIVCFLVVWRSLRNNSRRVEWKCINTVSIHTAHFMAHLNFRVLIKLSCLLP